MVPFLRPYRGLMVWGAVVLVVTALVSLALPLVARQLVDQFIADNSIVLTRYFALAFVGAAVLAAGSALRFFLIARLGERVVVDLRNAIFSKVIGLSPAFYERTRTGEVLSRITTDTQQVQSVVGNSAAAALRNAMTLAGGITLLVASSPKLAIVVLMIVPVTLGPIFLLGRKMRRVSRDLQDWIAASSGIASEGLSAVQTVQSFTHEAASRTQFQSFSAQALGTADRRNTLRAALTFSVMFLSLASSIVVFWLGVRDVQAGVTTPGTLVQFMIYAAMVAGSVTGMAQLWGDLQRAAGATDRLVELLNLHDNITDPAHPLPLPTKVTGHVAFEDVQFTYPTRPDATALAGVAMRFWSPTPVRPTSAGAPMEATLKFSTPPSIPVVRCRVLS